MGKERAASSQTQNDDGSRGYLSRPAPNAGYALPVVVVVATALLILGLAILQNSAAIRQALLTQQYDRLAREAGESGVVYAQYCLGANNNVVTWSDANPLRPNTNCQGSPWCSPPPANPACTSEQMNVVSNGGVSSTFAVAAVDASGRYSVTGTANLTTAAGGTYRSYTQTVVGATSFVHPIELYGGQADTYILGSDRQVWGFGRNNRGQLGNGTTTDQTTMVQFQLPGGVNATKLITDRFQNTPNINSQSTLVIGSDGNGYTAGDCSVGQLGDGSHGSGCYKSTPVMVTKPLGVTSWVDAVHDGAMLETCGSASGGAYLPGDRVGLSSRPALERRSGRYAHAQGSAGRIDRAALGGGCAVGLVVG
jgi:hypothetical protein